MFFIVNGCRITCHTMPLFTICNLLAFTSPTCLQRLHFKLSTKQKVLDRLLALHFNEFHTPTEAIFEFILTNIICLWLTQAFAGRRTTTRTTFSCSSVIKSARFRWLIPVGYNMFHVRQTNFYYLVYQLLLLKDVLNRWGFEMELKSVCSRAACVCCMWMCDVDRSHATQSNSQRVTPTKTYWDPLWVQNCRFTLVGH